jgi:6,7-dimethyl-8-ribityllumazine synthase
MPARYAIVVARFNSEVTDKLLAGAVGAFREQGICDDALTTVRVPGAFELPLVARALAAGGQYAAVVCLGAVIRGDTDHYDYVCRAATDGILRAGMDTGVPVIFGVLTCDTDEQAAARTGGAHGNKGADAARAAVEMAGLMASIRAGSADGP